MDNKNKPATLLLDQLVPRWSPAFFLPYQFFPDVHWFVQLEPAGGYVFHPRTMGAPSPDLLPKGWMLFDGQVPFGS